MKTAHTGAHTPGRWRVGDAGTTIFGPPNGTPSPDTIAHLGRVNAKANARLIAKAPEMREALAALFEHCAMVHKHWGDGNNTKEADKAIADARALLVELAS